MTHNIVDNCVIKFVLKVDEDILYVYIIMWCTIHHSMNYRVYSNRTQAKNYNFNVRAISVNLF